MRVVNDREEKTEPSELGILQVISYALFCAAGISTVVFCPLPMILAHLRLSDAQAKLSGLLGALIALTVLEIPLHVVVLAFIFGLFVGDGVAKERKLWKMLLAVGAVAFLAGLAMVSFQAFTEKIGLVPFWHELVRGAVEQMQKGVQNAGALRWDQLESLLLYEGPFLYISVSLMSFWISVGIVAHLGWFPEKHSYRPERLRENRLSPWVVALFVVLTLVTFVGSGQVQRITSGLARLVGSLVFIQGCITLSQLLNRKGTKSRVRTLIYSLLVTFGFYIIVAMGLISPWFTWRQKALIEI